MAQRITIELGPNKIPIDQYFTISVRAEGGEIKTIDPFPEISGFQKSTRFATTTTTMVAGVVTVAKSVTQRYAALEEGVFDLKPFSLRVNNHTVASKGTTITVGPVGAEPVNPSVQREEEPGEEPEYLDLQEDAFLSVSTSKKVTYVGEGVMATLWFYLAVSDQHLLEFHDFANQLPALIRQLRQKNAWEETVDQLGEVIPENVLVEEKEYLRYRLHSAVYYPLNTDPLVFPSVSLKMTKYKMAKNPSFEGGNRQQEVKMYTSRVKSVEVEELPPHPQRRTVPVGTFRLREGVSQTSLEAGKSVSYYFQLEGEGNLAAVPSPAHPTDDFLEVYPPEVTQSIERQYKGISGTKIFRFHLLPRQVGKLDLGNYFSFVYFNPAINQYDTLRSALLVQVTGPGDAPATVREKDLGVFYSLIHTEDSTLTSWHKTEEIKQYANIVLLFLLVLTLIMFLKKLK
jgi:hypothetical protein